jgi:hypothetical protein
MAASRRSRQDLEIGAVFFYRNFEDSVEVVKDRHFLVVHADDRNFYCFTAATQTYFDVNPRLKNEATPLIPKGCAGLPKPCRIDCRFLYEFDDIVLSNRLNTNRARVEGIMSGAYLQLVRDTVFNGKVLERQKKDMVIASLDAALDPEK